MTDRVGAPLGTMLAQPTTACCMATYYLLMSFVVDAYCLNPAPISVLSRCNKSIFAVRVLPERSSERAVDTDTVSGKTTKGLRASLPRLCMLVLPRWVHLY